ncbi:MAG: hydroxymethylbilane synthase [Flavobacteriales bacterium]|nr:hydroxymethylbilane synthase [Flavobacteriales bacterium]|tara:strand:- start:3427 stop:4341 length:915 start_codon:yes stop_codon:yes gene_type:complete
MKSKIIIGTRGSNLAMAQSQIVKDKLMLLNINTEIEIKVIKTKGDIMLNQSVQNLVDKGFFVNEIQEELINKGIDIAVHSLKDLPTEINKKIRINSVIKRSNPNDVFISHKRLSPFEMPNNSIIATSSKRRKYQLLRINPTFCIKEIRGNIDTRINKFKNGYCDAIVLAYAGLERLSLLDLVSYEFPITEMIPAAGQGAIAIESRKDDNSLNNLISKINCAETSKCVSVERKILSKLGLGCNAPVAVNVNIQKKTVKLNAIFFSLSKMKHVNIELEEVFQNIDSLADLALYEFEKLNYKNLFDE